MALRGKTSGVATVAVLLVGGCSDDDQGGAGRGGVASSSVLARTVDDGVSTDPDVESSPTVAHQSSRSDASVLSSSSTSPAVSEPAASSLTPATVSPVLRVVPFDAHVPAGAGDATVPLRIDAQESKIEPVRLPVGPGEVVLKYELGLGFMPRAGGGVVETPSRTTDGELLVEVECQVAGCLDLVPVNDAVQNRMSLTVRQAGDEVSAGEHLMPFTLRYDDGTLIDFDVALLAEQEPSAGFSELVRTSTGSPELVQTVRAPGWFAYHAISAFDSIWVIAKNSKSVTRIDATTGEILATIKLTDADGPYGSIGNRLAATGDAVYAVGEPAFRIDPATNTVAMIGGGDRAFGIGSGGDVVWTAGFEGTIQRITPDGSVRTMYQPVEETLRRRFMDIVVADRKVWALSQERSNSRLLALDPSSGAVVHDLVLSSDEATFGVRIVADEYGIVVGADTSGGGGRTGALYIVDSSTGTITDTVELDSRPEGIALTANHIWTTGSVLDRHTLEVVDDTAFGFTLARGPDGSIWGISAGNDGTFTARRFAPGDLR